MFERSQRIWKGREVSESKGFCLGMDGKDFKSKQTVFVSYNPHEIDHLDGVPLQKELSGRQLLKRIWTK
jgi:hypothetical protein